MSTWEAFFIAHPPPVIPVGEVYPPRDHIFRVFEMPLDEIKVVLLGQDPYHGAGQAMGLSFSVNDGVKIPPVVNRKTGRISNARLSIHRRKFERVVAPRYFSPEFCFNRGAARAGKSY